MVPTRLRKNVVISSDEDEELSTPTVIRRQGQKSKCSPNGSTQSLPLSDVVGNRHHYQSNSRSLMQPSSKKSRSTRSSTQQKASKELPTKPLSAFFRAASRQPPAPEVQPLDDSSVEDTANNDVIEDDYGKVHTSKVPRHAIPLDSRPSRKRSWSSADREQSFEKNRSASQKFVKVQRQTTASNALSVSRIAESHSSKPWSDVYAPKNLSELAVHHKKVADVRVWLESVFSGKLYQRLLVLKGPAGSGKSMTLSMLSSMIGYTTLQWHGPDLSDMDSIGYRSLSSQFADFIARAGQFPRLDLMKSDSVMPATMQDTGERRPDKRIILIEEFPNIGGSSSTALHSFRGQILQYLASSTLARASNVEQPAPLVIVISESMLSSSDTAENLTAHRLLGKDIIHHPATNVIEFNPVAPMFLTKALKLVLQKHSHISGRTQPISTHVIQRLAEIGDVRNAVATLEYLSKHTIPTEINTLPIRTKTTSKALKSSRSSKTQIDEPVNRSDEAAFALIHLRENTLGLFHAVGKVLYNKRSEVIGAGSHTTQRPPHDTDSADLLSAAGSSASIFISALHENYLLSCFDPGNSSDTDLALSNTEACLDALGDADILSKSAPSNFEGSRSSNTSSQGLRQDEIAFDVGVRGIQKALPYPVKRQAVHQGKTAGLSKYRADTHRMFYPMDIKLWRDREDIKDCLDYLVQQTVKGQLLVDSARCQYDVRDDVVGITSTVASGRSARLILLLEHLPYFLKIARAHTDCGVQSVKSTHLIYEAEKVVEFNGVGILNGDDSDDEESQAATSFNRRGRTDHRESAFSKASFAPSTNTRIGALTDEAEDKLTLSDDDIVDD